MCGEQFTSNGEVNDGPGSPPRVRGTVYFPIQQVKPIRITPACAGNSPAPKYMSGVWRDHPRVCGEQLLRRAPARDRRGSPPRVRGTVPRFHEGGIYNRITPACAGNSVRCSSRTKPSQDHPRVCGEQGVINKPFQKPLGSPPRVRGTDAEAVDTLAGMRITPACAGNREARLRSATNVEDHPRVCGEQKNFSTLLIMSQGSPPRVRGTGGIGISTWDLYRITPACAGNSRGRARCGPASADHPRVCGEQCMVGRGAGKDGGSPPRVRGTGAPSRFLITVGRITPACAGNSQPITARIMAPKDHPRVCGEQSILAITHPPDPGSPPRVRGTGRLHQGRHPLGRITPACAGNRIYRHIWLRKAGDHPRVCGEQQFPHWPQ